MPKTFKRRVAVELPSGCGQELAGHHVRPLDGVRAVAVGLVLLYHLQVPGFEAGFVGVDVFFVLSGFLITSLLLREHERHGHISLPGFWARRARRLLPALVLLLVSVATWARLGATFSERASARADLIATTGYFANWHLIGTSSYFSNSGIVSPLGHTWSLAIEEQFYVVWPLLVVLACWRSPGARVRIGLMAAATASVSILLMFRLWEPGAVERAYMGTDARIFQPLIGALGAVLVASPIVRPRLRRVGSVLLPLGAGGLAWCIATIEPSSRGYFAGGAVAVSVASLLIVAPLWVGAGGSLGVALSWRPIVWLGTISYGVYLWHWPIGLLVGVRGAAGFEHALRASIAAGLTLAVAAASYRWVELPIRHGLGTAGRATRRARRASLAAVPVALFVIASGSMAVTAVPPPPPGVPVVLFVGDSVPLHLAPALEQGADERGWRVVFAANGGCPVTGETPANPGGEPMQSGGRCASEVVPEQHVQVATVDPDVVVWWDRFSISGFLTDGGVYVRSGTERFWRIRTEELDQAVGRLSAEGAKVLLVATEPPGQLVDERIAQGCSNCEWWVPFQVQHYDDITMRWNEILREYAVEHPEVASFTSITDVVCRDDRVPCDDTLGGTPARIDGTHYGPEGGRIVAQALLDHVAPLVDAQASAARGVQALGGERALVADPLPTGVTMMLVGDSVPLHLRPALNDRAKEVLGWRVVQAARASCSVSAESLAWVDGSPRGNPAKCPSEVPPAQDELIASAQPEVVVWWDRFSIDHFLTAQGEFIRSGSARFWDLRAAALETTAARLTAGGAKLVFVATEPIGRGWASRCPDPNELICPTWLRFQIRHFKDITQRWNRMLHDFARLHPDFAAYVRITDEICARIKAPCNDRIRDVYARPDGTHYEGRGTKKAVTVLIREIKRALEPLFTTDLLP